MRNIYYGRHASHYEYVDHHNDMANTYRQLADNQRAAGNAKGVEHNLSMAHMHETRARNARAKFDSAELDAAYSEY